MFPSKFVSLYAIAGNMDPSARLEADSGLQREARKPLDTAEKAEC
jgi:hypothetical protein